MTGEHEVAERPQPRHRVADAGRTLRGVLAGLITAALVALGVDNRHDVRLGWVFGENDAPMWIIVIASAVAGALIGWLVTHRPRRRAPASRSASE